MKTPFLFQLKNSLVYIVRENIVSKEGIELWLLGLDMAGVMYYWMFYVHCAEPNM